MEYKMSIFTKVKDLLVKWAEDVGTVESALSMRNKLVEELTNLRCDGIINHWSFGFGDFVNYKLKVQYTLPEAVSYFEFYIFCDNSMEGSEYAFGEMNPIFTWSSRGGFKYENEVK